MTKAGDALRAAGFANGHDVCQRYAEATGKPMPVYVAYSPQELGRWTHFAKWQVIRPGFRTNPKGHFEDDGHKTFTVISPNRDRNKILAEAQAWAEDCYGVRGWGKIPGIAMTHFPREVALWANDRIRAVAREGTVAGRP